MKRIVVALALVVTACGGGDGFAETPTGSDRGVESTEAETPNTDTEPETTSDGTRIFVASGSRIDIVDLAAEEQDAFIDGFDRPYGLVVAQDQLWFSDMQSVLTSVDALSGEVLGTVALPGQFSGLAVTDDTAWVIAGMIGADSQLVGVEREGMTIRGAAPPPEGAYYDGVAASGDDVWVSGRSIDSSTSVAKVDPVAVTVGDPIDTGVIADSMVVAFGALWVGGTNLGTLDGSTDLLSAIAKLDQTTGEVLDLFEIGGHGDGEVVVESAFGHLWATHGLDAVLIKFDPASGDEVGRVEVGSGAAGIPYPILVTSDAIWVVNSTDGQALSFNPDTLEFEIGINMPTFAGAFAFVP